MSDEQNKDSLLVDQKDALGFYFDALLLPDENGLIDNEDLSDESKNTDTLSGQNASNVQDKTGSIPVEAVDTLQADKDFLRASKLRQGAPQEKVESEPEEPKPEFKTEPNLQIPEPVKAQQESKKETLESVQDTNTESASQPPLEPIKPNPVEADILPESISIRKSEKVITEGPVSPKPRLKEHLPDKETHTPTSQTTYSNKSSTPEIVFSSKNNEGEVSEQVLIPRSQRLANAKKSNPIHNVAKAAANPEPSQTEAPQNLTSSINKAPNVEVSSESKAYSEDVIVQDKILNNIDSNSQMFSEADSGVLKDAKTLLTEKSVSEQEPSVEKALPQVNEPAPITKRNTSKEQVASSQEEAPKIDLSLFLPKIKTLSEDEIAQQIEALTQAAVSQAQLESDLAHVAELEQVSQKILSTQADSEKSKSTNNIDNAPSWAVPNFQALLFTVAGLKLAVPLTELNGIVEWGDEYISELPGHKSWYLGIIQNQGKSVPVIDTLQQVVPKNRWPADYLTQRKFKHIIMIDNSHWGLACETVLEVVTLNTDAVKWRSTRTKRRWLMGTVIEHMCALLDSSEFAAMLKTGDDSLMSS